MLPESSSWPLVAYSISPIMQLSPYLTSVVSPMYLITAYVRVRLPPQIFDICKSTTHSLFLCLLGDHEANDQLCHIW